MAALDHDGLDGALTGDLRRAAVEQAAPSPTQAVAPGARRRAAPHRRTTLALCAAAFLVAAVAAGVRSWPRARVQRVPERSAPSRAPLAPTRAVEVARAPQPAPDPTAPSPAPWPALFPAHFTFNDDSPSPVDSPVLQQLVEQLATRCPRDRIAVTGYTCNRGSVDSNQRISLARAAYVARLLVAAGVPRARLRIIGAGSTDPIASNRTAEGRAANRRVVIDCRP